jgi:phage shock protein A
MSTSPQPTYVIPPPSGPNWKTPVVAGLLALLIGSNIYSYVQMSHLRAENHNEMAKLSSDLEKIRVASSEAVQESSRRVETLKTELARSQRAAQQAVGQAKIDAQRRVESLQSRVAEEQATQQQAINAVKQTADTATTQLASVSTDVGTVKTDVQTTRSQLDQTIANLKHATGELDSHSSLIATNANELKALRELGERNYTEFTISKSSKQPTKVADVLLELKKVDPKRNKFTIAITADDKTVEKKDRTLNEPVQFYTLKAKQPDEIVINQVRKDAIVGYLATPKVQSGRAGS